MAGVFRLRWDRFYRPKIPVPTELFVPGITNGVGANHTIFNSWPRRRPPWFGFYERGRTRPSSVFVPGMLPTWLGGFLRKQRLKREFRGETKTTPTTSTALAANVPLSFLASKQVRERVWRVIRNDAPTVTPTPVVGMILGLRNIVWRRRVRYRKPESRTATSVFVPGVLLTALSQYRRRALLRVTYRRERARSLPTFLFVALPSAFIRFRKKAVWRREKDTRYYGIRNLLKYGLAEAVVSITGPIVDFIVYVASVMDFEVNASDVEDFETSISNVEDFEVDID